MSSSSKKYRDERVLVAMVSFSRRCSHWSRHGCTTEGLVGVVSRRRKGGTCSIATRFTTKRGVCVGLSILRKTRKRDLCFIFGSPFTHAISLSLSLSLSIYRYFFILSPISAVSRVSLPRKIMKKNSSFFFIASSSSFRLLCNGFGIIIIIDGFVFDEKNHHIEIENNNTTTTKTFVDAMAKRPRRSEPPVVVFIFGLAAAQANPTKTKD